MYNVRAPTAAPVLVRTAFNSSSFSLEIVKLDSEVIFKKTEDKGERGREAEQQTKGDVYILMYKTAKLYKG